MQEETIMKPEEPQVKRKFFVFNFNTVLSIIILIGIGIFFYFHVSGGCGEEPKGTATVPVAGTNPLSVVFLNLDSLNVHYDFVKVLRRDLETTGKRLQSEVLAEQASLEKEAADFQRQVAANAITEEKAKVIYEQLMQKQQSLMEKKDRYTQLVAEQELNMNLRLLDTVTNFLKRYNTKFNYDFIMGFKKGGEILLPNESLDITNDALKAINDDYNSRKK
ncbi:MAG: OmpH family outer membrane protein [bacterium]